MHAKRDEFDEFDEIDDEFDHHIFASAEALARSGLPLDAARREAEIRFGDRGTHHRRCMRQSTEAHMARTRAIVGVLLLAVVAGIGADGWRRAVSAQQRVGELEIALRDRASAPSPVSAPLLADRPILDTVDRSRRAETANANLQDSVAAFGSPIATVKVLRPEARGGGLYALEGVPTLRVLLDTAGWPERCDAEIVLHRAAVDEDIDGGVSVSLCAASLRNGAVADVALRDGDTITIGSDVPPGVVYIDGAIARPGVYQLPGHGRLTALRLVAVAGGVAPDHSAVELRIIRAMEVATGERSQREYNLSAKDAEGFFVEPDDHLIVTARARTADGP